HILLVPALILGLIGIHLVLLVLHKHTQYPGPGRTERNVVGFPVFPVYAAKAGGFFFLVFGIITLISATTSINAVWVYGPYDPSPVSAGSQPDWYMLWTDGGLRLIPGWESTIFGYVLSWNMLIPFAVYGLLLASLALYPFIEAWVTGDDREHHLNDLPYNAPGRERPRRHRTRPLDHRPHGGVPQRHLRRPAPGVLHHQAVVPVHPAPEAAEGAPRRGDLARGPHGHRRDAGDPCSAERPRPLDPGAARRLPSARRGQGRLLPPGEGDQLLLQGQ